MGDIHNSSRHKKGKSVPAAPRSGAGNNLNNSHYDPDESRHIINGSVLTAGGGVQKSTIDFLQEEEEIE
jgi:hypothetical protein